MANLTSPQSTLYPMPDPTLGLWQAVADGCEELIAAVSPELRFLAFNRSYAEGFQRQFKVAPRVGMPLAHALRHRPGERRHAVRLWRRALAGETFTVTRSIRDDAGHLQSYRIRFLPLPGHGACQIVHLVASPAALEPEAAFRGFADALPQLVWTADPAGNVDYFNRHGQAYTGATLTQLQGWSWTRFLHPEDAPRALRAWLRALSRGEACQTEFRFRTGAGRYRWHVAQAVPLRRADGEPERYLSMATDIEAQVQDRQRLLEVQKALQAASARLEEHLAQQTAIITRMTEGLAVFDPDGTPLHMNPAALAMHGLDSVEDMGAHLVDVQAKWELRDRDGRELTLAEWPIARALAGDTFADLEVELHRRGSGRRWIGSFGGTAVYNGRGEMLFAIVTLRDVTAQRQTELALRESLQAREHFVSVASHELRTPLTALKLQLQSMARQLQRQAPDAPDLPRDLPRSVAMANRQVDRLARLVDTLLDDSRIAAGKLALELARVDLAEVVRQVLQQLAPELERIDVRVILDLAPVVGRWDPLRIEQVVINLVSNAIKYGGSPILISVRTEGNQTELRVRDHGPGIPRDHQRQIFERFERCGAAPGIGGLGLGLFIVKQIVAAHGGEIHLSSDVGQGAEFVVTLPQGEIESL